MAVFQDTRSAVLVDAGYLAMLERLHEEMRQAAVAESSVQARRHLLAALGVAEEVGRLVERGFWEN